VFGGTNACAGPEKSKPRAGFIDVGRVKRKPNFVGPDNVTQMPLGIGKRTD